MSFVKCWRCQYRFLLLLHGFISQEPGQYVVVYNVKSYTKLFIAIMFSISFSVLIYEEGGEATK